MLKPLLTAITSLTLSLGALGQLKVPQKPAASFPKPISLQKFLQNTSTLSDGKSSDTPYVAARAPIVVSDVHHYKDTAEFPDLFYAVSADLPDKVIVLSTKPIKGRYSSSGLTTGMYKVNVEHNVSDTMLNAKGEQVVEKHDHVNLLSIPDIDLAGFNDGKDDICILLPPNSVKMDLKDKTADLKNAHVPILKVFLAPLEDALPYLGPKVKKITLATAIDAEKEHAAVLKRKPALRH